MATEFITIVDPDNAAGTDFTSLSSFDTGVQSDLTSVNTKVFSHGGEVGTLGSSLTGKSSGATGTLIELTTSQILLTVTSGTFSSGEQVYSTLDTNYVVISDAGDTPIAVAECRATSGTKDSTNLIFGGWTTSTTNYIKVRRHSSEASTNLHKWDTSVYRHAPSTSSSPATFQLNVTDGTAHLKVENIQIENEGTYQNIDIQHSAASTVTGWIEFNGCIFRRSNTTTGLETYTMGGYGMDNTNSASFTLYFINNLFLGNYDNNSTNFGVIYVGLTSGNDYDVVFYNNTVASFFKAFQSDPLAANNILKNNIYIGGTNDIVADTDWDVYDYNHWEPNQADSAGTNGSYNVTITVEDKSTSNYLLGDFRITSGDTVAKGNAEELNSDSYYAFQDDIAGNDRGTETWDAGMFQVTPLFTIEQEGFRWRYDNGSESAAGWRENQDVDETGVDKNTINATGDPSTKQFKLQYKRTAEGASNWRDVKE
jgi:hypothetical protein